MFQRVRPAGPQYVPAGTRGRAGADIFLLFVRFLLDSFFEADRRSLGTLPGIVL